MSTRKERSLRNRQVHAVNRVAELGQVPPIDPLDEEPMETRSELSPIPWNKLQLSSVARAAVCHAILEGYPRSQIARALGTTVATLRRLITGDDKLNDAVAVRKDIEEQELKDILMSQARRGDTVAAIFVAKAQFGWRDRDDGKGKATDGSTPGVLVVPGVMPLDQWTAAAVKQQQEHRERTADNNR